MKKRWIVALLAFVLVFSLFGCDKHPVAETPTDPTVNEPVVPEPPSAEEVYAEARAELDGVSNLTLDVKQTVTTTVEDQVFVDESTQVLTYGGLNTEDLTIRMEKEVTFTQADGETMEPTEEIRLYSEIYTAGTLYVELEDNGTFCGSVEEIEGRYVPAVLLDASLYESLTLEQTGEETTVLFDAPTAAESWAIPAEAELIEASGSAVIGVDGKLQQMKYTVTYLYGNVEITRQVESTPRTEALEVAVPENVEDYLPLQYIDALQVVIDANRIFDQTTNASTYFSELVISYAGGVLRSQTTEMDMYTHNDKLMAKIETEIHASDPVNGEQSLKQEEIYREGKYTMVLDDGLPTTQSGIPEETIRTYCNVIMANGVARVGMWEDVTMTDLGGTLLLEFTYNEDFGNTMQNTICQMFYNNPGLLNSYASAYETKDTSGYFAVDKYSGAVTAAGMSYEGVHTIDGEEYSLILQKDQSVELPAFGAYKAITEQMQPEAEPEQKAAPLFYHVTGENGQEMWLLGTIHVGDERTGFLPQEIYDAFAASDALAMEIDSDAFDEQIENDEDLQQKVSEAYYYQDGTQVSDLLDEELYELALKHLKASGNYRDDMKYLKVSMWESSISNFYLRLGHQLRPEQGVEERLTALAKEQEKPIREVESTLFQIRMLTGWSEELAQLLLEDTLSYSAEEYWQGTYELYELWCAGDEEALREAINEEVDTSELTEEELAEYEAQLPLMEEYEKAMDLDRNDGMLKVAVEYLESGDVVFYAVGLAHLLNDTNGLVEALREAGYTVELVQYAQ